MIVAIGMVMAAAALTLELSSDTTNKINLTTDSSPGGYQQPNRDSTSLKLPRCFLAQLKAPATPKPTECYPRLISAANH